MPDINRAYPWAIEMCNVPNVGFSQSYRNAQTVGGAGGGGGDGGAGGGGGGTPSKRKKKMPIWMWIKYHY